MRSELSRLRHSYEQLRAKRSQQKAAVSVNQHGATSRYREECYSLRQQLVEAKETGRKLERHCAELKEQVEKGEERLEGERKQNRQGLAYLQETLKTKDGLIR